MMSEAQRRFWQVLAVALALTLVSVIVDLARQAEGMGVLVLQSKWIYLFGALGAGVLFLAAFFAFLSAKRNIPGLDALNRLVQRIPSGGVVVTFVLIVGAVLTYLRFSTAGFYTQYLYDEPARLRLFLILSLLPAFQLKAARPQFSWPVAWAVVLISMRLLEVVSAKLLLAGGAPFPLAWIPASVDQYATPFALGWSESSRYYGASLFFSERIYNLDAPLTVLHPAWHLMLTIPFLAGDLPIWAHRLWQVILEVSLPAAFTWVLLRPLRLPNTILTWLLGGWVYLYLLQGAILIHLLLGALVVTWLASPQRPKFTLVVVLIASVWAGISRINWFPMPAALASLFYLLEMPLADTKNWWKYLRTPLVWFAVGGSVAFMTNIVFMALAGNGLSGNFTSSLSSDLLWERLLPNATFGPGILPGILWVTGPLLLAGFWGLRTGRGGLHPLRSAGILGLLAVFFVGGLVVSVKIGGGADLHNMDVYLLLVLIVGLYAFFGQTQPGGRGLAGGWSRVLLAGFALLTVLWSLQPPPGLHYRERALEEQVLAEINQYVGPVVEAGEPVLFISQRQLLTFGHVEAPLVLSYEKDRLMEMAMAGNRAYLDEFHQKLEAGEFGLVVIDPLNIRRYDDSRSFNQENDHWIDEVSRPLDRHYYPIYTSDEAEVQLLVPREAGQ